MDDERDDFDLRRQFQALRAEDAAAAPRYRVRSPRPAPRRLPIGLAAAAALAVTVAGTMWTTRGAEGDPLGALGLDLNATTWTSPTDFLLDTPGAEFFGDLPTLFPLDSLAGSTSMLEPAQPNVPEDFS